MNAKLKSEEGCNSEFNVLNSFPRALNNLVVVVTNVKY